MVGWSLGGHIALEMAARFFGIKGLLISGAPPVSQHNMAEGFTPTQHMRLAGQQYLSPSEIDAFGGAIFGAPIPVAFRRAIERADGFARKTIFEAARAGVGTDQRCLVEDLVVPLAVVNGSQDPFIHLYYLEIPKYANLLEGRCHRLPGLNTRRSGKRRTFLTSFLEDSSTMSQGDDLRRSSTSRSRRPRGFATARPIFDSENRISQSDGTRCSPGEITGCGALFSL